VKRSWTATLRASSPRYDEWAKILGGPEVPITNPKPMAVHFGPDLTEAYMLDLDRLEFKQRERLKQFVADRLGVRLREVDQLLDHDGFPIRAEDVLVSYQLRAFL
jgi:hypothetical protein